MALNKKETLVVIVGAAVILFHACNVFKSDEAGQHSINKDSIETKVDSSIQSPSVQSDIQYNLGMEVMNYIMTNNLALTDPVEYDNHISNAESKLKEAYGLSQSAKTARAVIEVLVLKGDYKAALDTMEVQRKPGVLFYGAFDSELELRALQLKLDDNAKLTKTEKIKFEFDLIDVYGRNLERLKKEKEKMKNAQYKDADGELQFQFKLNEMTTLTTYMGKF